MMKNSIFSFDLEIEPFFPLRMTKLSEGIFYNISDIADVRGSVYIEIGGYKVSNDNPLLNIIEIFEFIYGLVAEQESSSRLTIDMEPVLYGWRKNDSIAITLFNSDDKIFNGIKNIICEIKAANIADLLHTVVQGLRKVAVWDPLLYMYIVGRMYRQAG